MRNILLILICFVTATTKAINGKLYTSELLASSSVTDICQDKYGFIWIATNYGLSKFDGYHFTNYYHVHSDSTSLPDNYIGCFITDNDSNLWIGHGKGMCKYDYANDKFIRQTFPNNLKPRVKTMVLDKKGNVIIGTAGLGVYYMDVKSEVIKWYTSTYADKDNGFTEHMYIDRKGNLWTSNHKNIISLTYLSKGDNKLQRKTKSTHGEAMSFINTDANHVLIVCKKGIMQYDYKKDEFSDTRYDFSDVTGEMNINHALLDKSGKLYLCTYGQGLLVIEPGDNKVRRVILNEGHRQQDFTFISRIMRDKNENLWMTCYDAGIFRTYSHEPVFNDWCLTEQKPTFTGRLTAISPASAAHSGTDGRTNGLLCASRQGWICHVNDEGQITSSINTLPELRSVCHERDTRYWISIGHSVYLLDTRNNNIARKLHFEGSDIGQIIYDGTGNLYISVFGKGLCKYNIRDEKYKLYNDTTNISNGRICNNWVSNIMMDSEGLIWIATATGVSCLNPANERFNSLGWDVQLNETECSALCETDDKNIVIGTKDGLYLYCRDKGKTIRFPGAGPLDDIYVCSIIKDNKGDLWLSTSKGIWQYVEKEKIFVSHLNGNGQNTREYVANAGLLLPDGRIAFGKKDGITIFNPKDIVRKKKNSLNTNLTHIVIDGKILDFRNREFDIPHDVNTILMEFSPLNFQDPDNMRIQYRLNNGPLISCLRGSNTIVLGKMKSGSYTLYIYMEDNNNLSDTALSLRLNVGNPWYLTAYAVAIYVLISILIIFIIIREHLKRKQRLLEEEKMKFLINATHDIRSPLTMILGPIDKLKEIVTDENEQSYLSIIERNAQRLMLLVNQILDERKIDKKQMRLHCRETNLTDFIKKICNLYQYNATQRGIKFTFEYDNMFVPAWIDHINFDKVISNILSNAFKYTQDNGEINVRLTERENSIEILITDNGIGIKNEDKQHLFDRFYQGHNADNMGIQGTGIGLNLSMNIVKMHGGDIEALDRPGNEQGACFKITIPKGNAHLKPEEMITSSSKEDISTSNRQTRHSTRVLLVDDDEEIICYITSELGHKYDFSHCNNGKEAMKTLLSEQYDIVISDVMMPEMDGVTLLNKIKNNPMISQIPVILLSSKSSVENRLDGLKNGADAYIAKPFNMDELQVQIDNLVDNVRRLRGKFSGALQQDDKIGNIEVKGNDETLMERVMKSINKNMSNPDYNVDILASDVGISRAQLHRKMKEITGVATGKFLRNLRMEQAARLLREGKINISQVADCVGYNDQTHFSTAFKAHFGITPKEYMDTNKNNKDN